MPEIIREYPKETREYPPDFYRQIAEPMVLNYLRHHFPCVRATWWAEGDLPNGTWLDQKKGIDGIIMVQPEEGPKRYFLGVQITTANLQNPESRGGMLNKLAAWRKNPIHSINGEASALGLREGELLPIVFFHMPGVEIDDAWQHLLDRPDWQDPKARKSAEQAAEFLPKSTPYRKLVLSRLLFSLDALMTLKPELMRLIRPFQEIFAREQERVLRQGGVNVK